MSRPELVAPPEIVRNSANFISTTFLKRLRYIYCSIMATLKLRNTLKSAFSQFYSEQSVDSPKHPKPADSSRHDMQSTRTLEPSTWTTCLLARYWLWIRTVRRNPGWGRISLGWHRHCLKHVGCVSSYAGFLDQESNLASQRLRLKERSRVTYSFKTLDKAWVSGREVSMVPLGRLH
jgi:hypothetical protein